MDQGSTPSPNSGEINVRELVAIAWQAKWTILVIMSIFTGAAAAAGLLNEKKYRAEVLLSPVADSPTGSAGGLGGIASQYGELASLAGLSLSGKGASNKDESV